MKKTIIFSAIFAFILSQVSAQDATDKFDQKRIEDNSFLLEEAYNQEDGVIQHISAFQYLNDKTWSYTFTEEIPVVSHINQFSVTIPIEHTLQTNFGDVLLNYRYQAILTNRLAFSPRVSLIIPTGDYKKEFGNGTLGYQINLPLSYVITPFLVSHYNFGTTFTPNAKKMDGSRQNLSDINYGASGIWLISQNFNFMLELAGNTSYTMPKSGGKTVENSLFLNPGFRYAINFKSGLQIVPGIAMPIGIGSSKGNYGIFGYLSFEHPW